MKRRARSLGSPSPLHVKSALDRFATAERTATAASAEARQGDCAAAFQHVEMAVANRSSGSAHAASVSKGDRGRLDQARTAADRAVAGASAVFKRQCLVKRPKR